jgi:hypothetical protein
MTIEQILFLKMQEQLAKAVLLANACAQGNGDDRYLHEADSFRQQLATAYSAAAGTAGALHELGLLPEFNITLADAYKRTSEQLIAELKADGTPLK